MRILTLTAVSAALVLALGACGEDSGPTADAVTADAATDTVGMDAGADVGAADPGAVDPGTQVDPGSMADPGGQADAGPQDTGPPPAANCLAFNACQVAACKAADAASIASCLAKAETTCQETLTVEESELALAQGLASCLTTYQCLTDGTADAYECRKTNCLSEAAQCWAGPTFGAGTGCSPMRACVKACPKDLFGVADTACVRTCTAQNDQATVEAYVNLQMCFDINCWDKAGGGREICEQQVQNTELCSTEALVCSGTDI